MKLEAISYWSAEAWWQTKQATYRLWLIIKHRPLIVCPFCKGKGGEMSGYYEPEWSECRDCWHHWDKLDDHGLRWFAGRLPVLWYLRARASMWCGLWYATTFTNLLRCKLGIHLWMNEDDIEPGLKICCVCYSHKKAGGKAVHPDDL